MNIETGLLQESIFIVPEPFVELIQDSPLTGDLYVLSLGYIPHTEMQSIRYPQKNDGYTFIFCSQGKGYVTIANRYFNMDCNQYIVLPKNIPYSFGNQKGKSWSIYWIKFDGKKASFFIHNELIPHTIFPSVSLRIDQRIEIFNHLYTTLTKELSLERLNYANCVFAHLIASFHFKDIFELPNNKSAKYIDSVISRTIFYMKNNLEQQLSLKEIADYAGYSPSYLYRQFIKQTSYSPIDYFIRLKINQASIYLLKTAMSISEISIKLGFNSPDYFSRTFKRIIGISASDFRKQDFKL